MISLKSLFEQLGEHPHSFQFDNFKVIQHKIKEAKINVSLEADDIGYGVVRVRYSKFDRNDSCIDKAKELLDKDYITVITPGSGSYSDKRELVIYPKIENAKGGISYGERGNTYNDSFKAVQSMIREDVWQLLLNHTPYKSYNGNLIDIDYFKCELEKLKKYKEIDLKARDAIKNGEDYLDYYRQLREYDTKDMYETMCCLNMSNNWVKNCNINLLDSYIEQMAEVLKVRSTLLTLRTPWMSGHTFGEQHGSYTDHKEFYSNLSNLCDKKIKEYEDEYYEDDEEY